MFKKSLLSLIKLYQRTISPDHGLFSKNHPGSCRFHPTCSQYSYQAIEKYGVVLGSIKGMFRIFHCHPFSKGGLDPLK